MLKHLPEWLPELGELMLDLGLKSADVPDLARTLGVTERTVWNWKRHGAPKMALLSLWWLSRWGHSYWDCEMERRTRLALDQADSLWREVRRLRTLLSLESAEPTRLVGRPGRAANEPDDAASQAPAACGQLSQGYRPGPR